MKIETLHKRLSQKLNCPELIEFLRGEKSPEELPDTCLVWTGKKTQGGPRVKRTRDRQNIPVPYVIHRRPLGQMQIDGESLYVHRVLYGLLHKPTCEFTMNNVCGDTLCANPKHWAVHLKIPEVQEESSDWSEEEVIETIEYMLGRYEIFSWEDVMVNPLTQDIPAHQLKNALIKIGKEHLIE